MPDMLRIGLSGLLTFQRSLTTSSHNISNANTEGYSRQRTELTAVEPQGFGNGFFGRGVGVDTVNRITNRFVELRLTDAVTDSGRSDIYESLSARLDDLLASSDAGLAPTLQGFFTSIQNMSTDPSSAAARELVLSEADTLIGRFRFLDDELSRLSQDMNGELQSMVGDINALARDLAQINDDIVVATGQYGGHPPNDLLDQRQQRLNELADLVSINAIEQDNGAINVFIGNGQPLVINSNSFDLTTAPGSANPEQLDVARVASGTTVRISEQISGGRLGGLLDFRREVVPSVRNELGRVATVLAQTFNDQHARGLDADGNLGGAFFDVPVPTTLADSFNTGTATVTTTITDVTQLEASDYSLDYDGAAFTLTRLSDGASVTGAGPLVMDGLQISISAGAAAGDSFLVRPVARGAELIDVAITDTDRIAAAAPVRSEAALGNLGDALIEQPDVVDETDPGLLDSIDIVFNDPPTTFDVIDVGSGTPLAAGVAYVEGGAITVNGWSTRITGNPIAGDSMRIEANVGGIGDNRNALALGALQTTNLVGSSATLEQGYSTLVARVGITARQAQFNAEANANLLADAQNRRDEISGVNLDEEAIDLTRYQRAYQAMAQTIETSNTVFSSLLAAIRT